LYEQLLAHDFSMLDVEHAVKHWPAPAAGEARVRQMFGATDFVETAITETRAKQVSPPELRAQLDQLKATWPAIRSRLEAQLIPATEIQRRLALVGAPTEPEQIGLTRARLRDSFFRAYHIRRRFTVLDVAVRTGTLDALLDRLFGPDGVWSFDPISHS
jgi:glycerol-1-phosphate dehydrogenase [NAD(P)+]